MTFTEQLNFIRPGQTIMVQPRGMCAQIHYDGRVTPHTFEPWTAKVLVKTPQAFICEGSTPQTSMAQWVQDACTAAGLDPTVTIRLAYKDEVNIFW